MLHLAWKLESLAADSCCKAPAHPQKVEEDIPSSVMCIQNPFRDPVILSLVQGPEFSLEPLHVVAPLLSAYDINSSSNKLHRLW